MCYRNVNWCVDHAKEVIDSSLDQPGNSARSTHLDDRDHPSCLAACYLSRDLRALWPTAEKRALGVEHVALGILLRNVA